jgi:hypothetical protein
MVKELYPTPPNTTFQNKTEQIFGAKFGIGVWMCGDRLKWVEIISQ